MPSQGKKIKAVFFDLDDTLLPTTAADAKALQDVAALLADSHPDVRWDAVHSTWKTAFGKAPWDAQHKVPVEEWRARLWQDALEASGVRDSSLGAQLQAHFTQQRSAGFVFDERAVEVIEAVRARGLSAVIITNGHPEIQRGKLAACGAATSFAHILVGGEEIAAGRAEKPAASIFYSACKLAGCQPHEAVHIGDSLGADIQGGINAGLGATIWVNPLGTPLPRGAPQPTFTVQHVAELLGVLDQLTSTADGD